MTDAPPPVVAEATGIETVDIEHDGETYTLPIDIEELDGDIAEALEGNKLTIGLRLLMGPEQWKRFKATKPKVRAYAAIIDKWGEATGIGRSPE